MGKMKCISKEIQREIDDALDPYSFEKYCESCIYYPYGNDEPEGCKHPDKAGPGVEWKRIRCKNFMD